MWWWGCVRHRRTGDGRVGGEEDECADNEERTKQKQNPRTEKRTFPRSRMNSNRIVQILLRRAHLDGDAEALHDLVRAQADDVDADDALLGARADHLVHRRLLELLGQHREVERAEGRLVDLDVLVAVLLACLGLRQPDRNDRWVADDAQW